MSNNIGLGHQLISPVYRGCLYSNDTKWFLDLRPDFRLDVEYAAKYHTGSKLLNFLLKYNFSRKHIFSRSQIVHENSEN